MRAEVPRPGELRIRISAIPERDEESLVTEAQAAAAAHGYEVAPEHIEVLNTSVEDRGRRRKLSYLKVTRAADALTAWVGLELAGDTLIGEREIDLAADVEPRAVVEAILNIVAQMTDAVPRFASVDVLWVGQERVVVVALIGGRDAWVGSAEVGADLLHATARATLKAINRSLERWIP